MEMGLVQTTEKIMEGRGRGRPGGPECAEYLLVVYPNGDLLDRLLEEQLQFSSDYGLEGWPDQGRRGAHSPRRNKPHITLAAFQAGEEAEDTLIRWIERILCLFRSFEVALNNYSGIPPQRIEAPGRQPVPGTIYLRVQDPEPLRQLVLQLGAIDEFIQSSGWPPVRLMVRPYLSIAGGLTEQLYRTAMPDYSRKTFHGVFRVGELVLLKRRHAFDPCKTVNVFGLRS